MKYGLGFMLQFLITALFFFLFSVTNLLAAPTSELMLIQKSIGNSKARWQAGETDISKLPPEERYKYLGLEKSSYPEDSIQKKVTAPIFLAAETLPSHIDWRDHNGANWVTSSKHQSSCGSCWAFAGAGAMESLIAIQADNPTLDLNLSEQLVLSCSNGNCSGWTMFLTLNFLQNVGTVDEACLQYTASDSTACNRRCADWSSRIRKISDWSWVPNTVNSIRAALNEQVLTTTMVVYTDFYYYTGGVYEHLWGDYQGGHAVILVGYDDIEHAWIAKNSWGSSWGDNGFFKILWEENEIGDETSLLVYNNQCDHDEDGYTNVGCGGNDCDDYDYLVYPGAAEICDGKDSNCDSTTPANEADNDEDGYPSCNDCDDSNPERNPGEVEICADGIDNNCSGTTDKKDEDEDGDMDPACGGADCDDNNPNTYSGADEICDGLDNDCNGSVPEDERDEDGDTWLSCAGECNDDNASVHPGQSETCGNFIDDDCDGNIDAQDLECELQQWAPSSAEASTTSDNNANVSYSASRIGNSGLWILFPMLALIIGKIAHYRKVRRQNNT